MSFINKQSPKKQASKPDRFFADPADMTSFLRYYREDWVGKVLG
jgi:hypothetical protein